MVSFNHAFIIHTVFSCSVIKSLIIELVHSIFTSPAASRISRSNFNSSVKDSTINRTAFSSYEIFLPTGTVASAL